ncbi:MAG TPA: STAS domain-containing protein [Mycobacterium sp.]
MTATTTTSGATAAVDCGGAQVRAHHRQLATVVAIRGRIDATNVDQVSEQARRFVLAKGPLVVDLSGVDSFAAAGIWLLCVLDGDCGAAGVEWTLVESPAVSKLLSEFEDEAKFPTSPSVPQALHALAEMIAQRRQLLLPLFKKTA